MATERLQRRIEQFLDEAEGAVARLDWAVVRDRARAVLGLDQENEDGLALLAAAERELGETSSSAPATSISSAPAAPSDQPTSFANGRYQVKRSLGEGGKKRVYLAQDTLLDREVAFALIKTEGLDEVSRTRITREAQAMGRLGSHPHIVTVFDLGDHEGQPFMVTEPMGGGDVEGVIEEATDHRLPLEQAIEIARETCRGLEFAHSRGIVHSELFSHMGNVGQDDWETFRKPEVQEAFPFPFWEETLGPLESLGIVEALSGEQALTSEVTAIPTPEHAPGSMSLAVASGGQQALILGDVFHGPTQVTGSDWVFSFDMDPDLAIQTRKRMIDRAEAEDTIVGICHHTGFGRIVRSEGKRYWQGL